MAFVNLLLLFLAAALAGALNSVAGGGSFISFPALIYTNVLPKLANATNTVALWPGSVAAVWALRKELFSQNRVILLVLGVTSLVGGVAGALLLVYTPQATFTHLIPYLLLFSTLLFALSPLVNTRLKQRTALRQKEKRQQGEMETASPGIKVVSSIAALQLIIATYGGYFGGGIGILMLAALGIMGMENIHEMNAVKNTLASCINGVAVITFILFGAVIWPYALIMIVGAIIGGFGGAYYARKLNPRLVRGFVILVGCVMTVYFFTRYGFF